MKEELGSAGPPPPSVPGHAMPGAPGKVLKREATMTAKTKTSVINNTISAQFEAVRDGAVVGLLAYEKLGTHFDLRHTFVPIELRGQRIGHTLVADALDQIRAGGGTATASCTYVAAFVEQHPIYADLVQAEPPDRLTTTATNKHAPRTGTDRPDALNVFPDTIVTKRLSLRPWTLDDTDEAFKIYSDPRVTRWTRPFINPVTTPDVMRRRLDSWIRQSDHLPPPQGRWAIELNDSAALIGGAHLLEQPTQGEDRLVMSWELAPSATGLGFAVEAGHGVVHAAFTVDPALEAIHALAHPTDRAAIATLGRLGLRALPRDRTAPWCRVVRVRDVPHGVRFA